MCDPGVDLIPGTLDDLCDTATVTVGVNGRPTAVNDTAMTPEDVSVVVDVLANDLDPDSPPAGWRVISVTNPPHGNSVINAGLTVIYTPDPNYQGTDSFGYTMNDGEGGTSAATVNVTVTGADDAPIAYDDPSAGLLSVGEGSTISIGVLANDLGLGDEPLTVAVTSGPVFPGCPSAGTAVAVGSPGPASGISINYTAPTDECGGAVTFDYTVTDFDGDADTATVTVTVTPVNDPPIARDDPDPPTIWTVLEDTLVPITLNVAANDTDEETAVVPASVAIVSCPAGATCVANGDGTVDFSPPANYPRLVDLPPYILTFTYTIQDTLLRHLGAWDRECDGHSGERSTCG